MPNEHLARARKEHVCCLCCEPIHVGTQYVAKRLGPHNSENDYFWTYRAHAECDRIRNDVADELPDNTLPTCRGDWDEILELHAELPQIRAERARLRRLADEQERQRRVVHA